jgi:hypothetical protein
MSWIILSVSGLAGSIEDGGEEDRGMTFDKLHHAFRALLVW